MLQTTPLTQGRRLALTRSGIPGCPPLLRRTRPLITKETQRPVTRRLNAAGLVAVSNWRGAAPLKDRARRLIYILIGSAGTVPPGIEFVHQGYAMWLNVVVFAALALCFFMMSTATRVDVQTQLAAGERRGPMIACAGLGAMGMIPPSVVLVRLDQWSWVTLVVVASMAVTFSIVCARLARLVARRSVP
jgi:hypothetical protein